MIFIKTGNDGLVTFFHYLPFDEKVGMKQTEEELKRIGHLVDSIPQAEERTGYEANLYYNEGEFSYKYVESVSESSLQEKIQELKKENEDLKSNLTELLKVNEQNKLETQLAIAELASMITGGGE